MVDAKILKGVPEMFVDFEYYKMDYCGEKIETEGGFVRAGKRAEAFVRSLCGGKIETLENKGEAIPEGAKDAVCAVAELYYDETERGGIATETTDGYSVTYSSSVNATFSEKRLRCAKEFLAAEGLLQSSVCVM